MVIGKERGIYLPLGIVINLSKIRSTIESKTVYGYLYVSRSSIVGNNKSKNRTDFTEFKYIKRKIK